MSFSADPRWPARARCSWAAVPPVLARPSPNEKVRFACIGVGGKGDSDTNDAGAHGEIVALCDIDSNVLDKMGKKYPKAKKYFDYRKMLEEMGDKIDAVTVSTPDHTHAPASVMAMRMGKHCFCQKPLTWSIEEARLMRTLAAEKKLCTQMGNQGTAENGFRAGVELIRSAVFSGRSRRSSSGPIARSGRRAWAGPRTRHGIPNHVRWYEFLGPAHDRPYHADYQPFNWRGWLDFGTGALGDMACHTINIACMALELFDPESVEVVDTSGIVDHESYPVWSIIRTRFGPRNGRGPLTMTWFDGGEKFPEEKKAYKEHLHGEKVPESGLLLVGEKGSFFSEERLRRRAHPASQGQVQGSREAQADPAALARPLHRMGQRHQGRRSQARRCRISTTPAGSPRPCSWASSHSRPAPPSSGIPSP